ncbi:Uncharacterized conserved protein YafD, endonuclease/exonuclease/phosphatase (EEP) superfamily [Rubrimonas cliftonensis]|uniref:Uncharacterized conserved protein YafD, endonuclease/exonuclease/phosphatase (EEP) superfamily n=1 Tax=Rubrimonas cliftonensis TaxID=89524 RepID=A0A1H3VVZ1_9RHOB|nr:Uncharacterized conserved protein YafD, endonuclease/exonuclease/phosphatase (EEP) superfamily [Rubrimonas cliftonensis]
MGLAALACSAIALAGLGPALRSPIAPPAPGDVALLTVALANVDISNTQPDAAQETLAALGADVLVTLETVFAFRAPEGALSRRYGHVVNRVRYVYTGAWLWSTLEPAAGAKVDNSADRPALVWGRFDLPGGGVVTVVGLHLRRPLTEPQESQIAGLLAALPPLDGPLIVLGDFNAAPWSVAVSRVAEQLGVAPVGGLRMTWRSKLAGLLGPLGPLMSLPLDHALVSPGIGVEEVRSFELPGSDHRGLLLRLQAPRRSAPTASATQEKPSRASSASSPRAMRAPRLTPPNTSAL